MIKALLIDELCTSNWQQVYIYAYFHPPSTSHIEIAKNTILGHHYGCMHVSGSCSSWGLYTLLEIWGSSGRFGCTSYKRTKVLLNGGLATRKTSLTSLRRRGLRRHSGSRTQSLLVLKVLWRNYFWPNTQIQRLSVIYCTYQHRNKLVLASAIGLLASIGLFFQFPCYNSGLNRPPTIVIWIIGFQRVYEPVISEFVLSIIHCAFSETLNLTITLAIIGRMIHLRRYVTKYLGSEHAKKYTSLTAIFVESGVMFSVLMLICNARLRRRAGVGFESVVYAIMGQATVSYFIEGSPRRCDYMLLFFRGYAQIWSYFEWPWDERGRVKHWRKLRFALVKFPWRVCRGASKLSLRRTCTQYKYGNVHVLVVINCMHILYYSFFLVFLRQLPIFERPILFSAEPEMTGGLAQTRTFLPPRGFWCSDTGRVVLRVIKALNQRLAESE